MSPSRAHQPAPSLYHSSRFRDISYQNIPTHATQPFNTPWEGPLFARRRPLLLLLGLLPPLRELPDDDRGEDEGAEVVVRLELVQAVGAAAQVDCLHPPRQVGGAAPTPAPKGTPPAPAAAPPAAPASDAPDAAGGESARAGRALAHARGGAHAGGLVVGDVLVRIDRVVHERPQHAARVQRRDRRPVARAVDGGPADERAPVEREAEHRLRPVGHALRQRVQHPQRRAREAEANRVRRQAHEHREPRRQLRAEEAERLRHAERARRERPRLCALPLTVDVAVPQVVDRAAGAAHRKAADAKKREQCQVGRRARRRRERRAPRARPQQQPRADRPVPARELAVRHRRGGQPAVQPALTHRRDVGELLLWWWRRRAELAPLKLCCGGQPRRPASY